MSRSRRPSRPVELRRDHARPRNAPAPTNAAIEARLTEIVRPATYALADQYRRLGLRLRVLTLPVMVCLLVTLIWRQVPAVSMLAQLLSREQLLWTPPRQVSQQALNVRLRMLPPSLFRDLVQQILPQLAERARQRSRPRSALLTRTLAPFPAVWAVDATTLEALFKKVGLLHGIPQTVLAGKLAAIVDVASKLPVQLFWEEDATVNERSFLDQIKAVLPPGVLVLLDKGFFGFPLFDWFTDHQRCFIMPDRQSTVYTVVTVLQHTARLTDEIIELGKYRSNPCRHRVRRIVLTVGTKHYAYLTNVLDPATLSAADVAALYGERWRIEEAFLLTKRLLGLSYLWTGAANGIELQVWTTWLLYAILVDLTDDVAEELQLPLARISLEMVFRGLYFFVGAVERGEATDPAKYLASQSDLGIVKRKRPRSELDKAIGALP